MKAKSFDNTSIATALGILLTFATSVYGNENLSRPLLPSIELLLEIPETETITEIEVPVVSESPQIGVGAESSSTITESAHVGVNSGGWSLNNTTIGYANGRMAVPFVMRGTRIDAIRLYHIYRAEGYGSGNGGTLKYEIYSDADGKPGGQPLAVTDNIIAATDLNAEIGWNSQAEALQTYPGAAWNPSNDTGKRLTKFRKIPFKEPAYLTKGGHYWYVVTNTSPEPNSNYISINNVVATTAVYADDPWYTHPASTNFIDRQGNGDWQEKGDIPIYEFYGDVTFGRVWMEEPYPSNDDKGYALTPGKDQARQVLTLSKTDSFSSISLFAGRISGAGSITFELKDPSGTVITSGEFADFPALPDGSGDTQRRAMTWNKVVFDSPVILDAGEKYALEFSASSSHRISSFRDGAKSGFFEGSPNGMSGFPEGYMQISTNNGEDWSNPTQWGNPQSYMDIEMYLTR